jgi:ribosomal protein S18 acetylase RimI-like enzyme
MTINNIINYRVKSLEYNSELKLLEKFMLNQPQRHPNFKEWVDGKCIPRIDSEEYVPFLLFDKKDLVGDLVYRHLDKEIIELKNFRIDKNYHNQYWGKVLLKQLEIIANKEGFEKIITDVSLNNHLAIDFFIRNGFEIKKIEELYLKGQKEAIIEKTI